MKRDLNNFLGKTDVINFVAGSVWRLPILYPMKFPPSFFFKDNDDGEGYISEGYNEYWFEEGKYNRSVGTVNVINEAEVRLFFVIQNENVLLHLKKIRAIDWHTDYIIGLTISSCSNLTKEKTNIELRKLREENDYPYHHYLSTKNNQYLTEESYTPLTAIYRIHKDYFQEKVGDLSKEDYEAISRKFKKVFYV